MQSPLLDMPLPLLAKYWPADRVVAGFMVCHHIRRELSQHADKIILVKREGTDVTLPALGAYFRSVSHMKVALSLPSLQILYAQPSVLMCVFSLRTALVHLDLSETNIGEEGAGTLARVLGECGARLAHLNLSCADVGFKGTEKLVEALGGYKALVHLDLGDNQIGDEGVEILAGVLGGCKLLAHLGLWYNRIVNTEGRGLSKLLEECKTLAYLDASMNHIEDEGMENLAGVLRCSALAYLDLGSNDFGDEGAGRLAGVLGGCKTLAHLNLQDNKIGDDTAEKLAGVLGRCKALDRLVLHGNERGCSAEDFGGWAERSCGVLEVFDFFSMWSCRICVQLEVAADKDGGLLVRQRLWMAAPIPAARASKTPYCLQSVYLQSLSTTPASA